MLSSLVHPFLSIFTRLTVKCSFNIMNNIIDHMEIDTCSAIMKTKCNLKSSKKSTVVKFARKDVLRDPVNSELSYYA